MYPIRPRYAASLLGRAPDRPYAVVPFITRTIVASMTVVDSNGDSHFIPAKTLVSLDYAAAFRDPKTWPRRTEVSSERRARLHD